MYFFNETNEKGIKSNIIVTAIEALENLENYVRNDEEVLNNLIFFHLLL